jgi:hypothetical protein
MDKTECPPHIWATKVMFFFGSGIELAVWNPSETSTKYILVFTKFLVIDL